MRFRKIRRGLDGSRERIARVIELSKFGKHDTDAVPSNRLTRIDAKNLPVHVQRLCVPTPANEEKGEVQTRLREPRLRLERRTEGSRRNVHRPALIVRHGDIVVRESIAALDRYGTA